MARHFNTAGPCMPGIHYMLPTERRLPGVRALIDQQAYFILHAPRQVGKTTALTALAASLTQEGRYASLLVSMESGAPMEHEIGAAEGAILKSWELDAESSLPPELRPPPWPQADAGSRIRSALAAWARVCPRPLVLFLDEIDALGGATLLSVLRQLRDGHRSRPKDFPWSLALVGLRDVRDYKVASGGRERLDTASPFNIKAESLTLRDFTAAEVAELYAQHRAETGQSFAPDALARVFSLTAGQPWLVNALARQLVQVVVTDRAQEVTATDVDRAKEILIERRDTHIDSLAERLREPRVRRVIAPMLAGGLLDDVPDDDLRFVIDLGLVRRTPDGALAVANPIYREVIARSLMDGLRATIPPLTASWLKPDASLDTERLLKAFMAFWRQHGEALLGAAPYSEVAAQLVMMAFLWKVVNGGGSVEREYALGRGRIDLCVRHGGVTLVVELKTWRSRQRDPEPEGLGQLDEYLDHTDADAAWLVVFDQRARRPPPSKRTRAVKKKTPAGRKVTVVRL